MIKLALPAMAI